MPITIKMVREMNTPDITRGHKDLLSLLMVKFSVIIELSVCL